MDETAIACIEEAMHLGLPLDVEAILLIETDGSDEASVLREIEAVARICQESGARQVKVAQDEAERASLWKARRSVSPSLARKAPNKLGEDITVPRSAIPEAVRAAEGHQRQIRSADRHLRPRRGRQPASQHPVRQARPGAVGEGRADGQPRSSPWRWSWAARSPASTASGR